MSDLTYIQKIAIQGEISKIVSIYNRSETETMFGAFMCMCMYSSDYFEDVVDALKLMLNNELVDKISFYYTSRIVPYELYTDKMVEDLGRYFDGGFDEEPEALYYVKSLLCSYIQKLQEVSPATCHMFLGKVLKDETFKAIHDTAFYLKSNTPVPVEAQLTDKRLTEKEILEKYTQDCMIFKMSITTSDVLDFMECLEGTKEEQKEPSKSTEDALKEKFSDLPSDTYYEVRKVNITSGKCVSTRLFTSLDAVIYYLDNLVITEEDVDVYRYVVLAGGNIDK